jgi:beta-glucosidase
LFPFGHGLSYTNFTYSNLKVSSSGSSKKSTDVKVTAAISIKNAGHVDGAEVAQAYLSFPESAGEPPKVLRGFEKVFLKQGKQEQVQFELTKTELSIWDTVTSSWVIPSGTFTLHVGASSRDIRQSASFSL